jgi:hypothetical protein
MVSCEYWLVAKQRAYFYNRERSAVGVKLAHIRCTNTFCIILFWLFPIQFINENMYWHKKGDVSNLETGISNLRTPKILNTALNVTERRII